MKSNRVLFKPPLAGLKSPNLQVKGSYSLLLRSHKKPFNRVAFLFY